MPETIVKWHNVTNESPPVGSVVRVIYADGMECNATRAGGRIYYPVGSDVYRYVDVLKWRELTEVQS